MVGVRWRPPELVLEMIGHKAPLCWVAKSCKIFLYASKALSAKPLNFWNLEIDVNIDSSVKLISKISLQRHSTAIDDEESVDILSRYPVAIKSNKTLTSIFYCIKNN